AGQELTRFRLHAGETARTPLMVVQYWEGDRTDAQNTWRRWMVAHNLPRPAGRSLAPQTAGVSGNHFAGLMCNAADEIRFLDRYAEERIPLTYWWMDAGWYPCDEAGWPKVGTWEPDPIRFPRGLRPVCDRAHDLGIRTLLWLEPERVSPGTWLYEQHPEWLLGPEGGQRMLGLGHPEARAWLTDHVDRLLGEQGIDLYRQDHNFDPLELWRAADGPDRQGLTEMGHVTGYLAFWDELRRRRPGLVIDSCASGGRRNDLETLRRAVPLLRSDYWQDPVGQQCHTYGIAPWYPFYGSGFEVIDRYTARSVYLPHMSLGQDVRRRDLDYELLRQLCAEWQQVSGYLLGDFYPLTSYSLEDDAWMAWQFDRPEDGEGMVQAFRRARSPYESARLPLRGLDPGADYELSELDEPGRIEHRSGQELMGEGLAVTMRERPQARIVVYRRRAPGGG
ncbi:MAG: alpha-galactosidase, partial [Gemmatimonadota bacterium]